MPTFISKGEKLLASHIYLFYAIIITGYKTIGFGTRPRVVSGGGGANIDVLVNAVVAESILHSVRSHSMK